MLRKTLIAAVATMIGATSIIASNSDAYAFREMSHRAPMHRHHGGGGFGGGFGGGLAVGLGAAVIGHAIATQRQQGMSRHEYLREMTRLRVQSVTKAAIQKRKDCNYVLEWEKLVKTAEKALERDIQMHNQYGEGGHSIENVRFQEQELERRREELRKAKAQCA